MTVSTVEFGVNYKFTSSWAVAGAPPAHPAGAPSPILVYKSPPARYAYDWTGIYFGADGGFGWTMSTGALLDAMGTPLTPYSYRVNGPVAGLFVGGNYQINKIVLGVEGDWQWSNLTRQQPNTCAARRRRHFSVGALSCFDHGEGLRLSPRPLGIGV